MNKFELFTMTFFTLNHYWKENKNDELGNFLSSMNPFLFEDIGSAIPDVYSEFCKIIENDVTVENSFEYAQKYIDSISLSYVKEAFEWIDEQEWKKRCKIYLSSEHKGSE